ncbi:MAG: DUF2723 domain-containing protein [Candidatus Amulumruptor caecigallinarius]|nr:DUF2723 domain-containing protein [Candidatus Amulumruptor caecigallinarius]
MIEKEKKYLPAGYVASWGAFLILLATYWSTVPPTVSFWDCPEYVSAACLLEVGHPPGNPVWMLVERIVCMLAPSPRYAALAINLSSGLFTALAALFLGLTIFRTALWVTLKMPRRKIPAPLTAAAGAFVGALAFGWCDSAWFSAVEAEVYAMSIFMTALCVWLMTKWAGTRSRRESWHLLVLLAYLFGLSVGVHQLNLLCIPALAMIWAAKRNIKSPAKIILIFILSLGVVGCVLMGMMPSTIALAARLELLCVNTLNLPALSGVALYVILVALSLVTALFATTRSDNRGLMAAATFPAIFLSGIFIISDQFLIGAAISALVAIMLVRGDNFKARRLNLAMWMLAMLLTGYSSYALIPIRGSIPSPANAVMPGNPFAFASYQSREQYGSSPLLYGPTPYSKQMLRETYSDGVPEYTGYFFEHLSPQFMPKEENARPRAAAGGLTATDSAANDALMKRKGDAYVMTGRKLRPVTTPELNMWFPRIHSNNPSDIESYAEWIGMDTSTMIRVDISEAFDSLGRPVKRRGPKYDGRPAPHSFRPTYLQNLQWLASYQTGYMYWRYLLWNFSGRQNDIPAQGEVQHGNFITGFTPLDNAMLGAEDYLPDHAGRDNPGRNRYFMLPLLLGLGGIFWLLGAKRRGTTACAVICVLFLMSGLAITIYLNQDPGEPRERDYSFLGSYWAWCVWIGFGTIACARIFKNILGALIPLAVIVWMGIENYDDHDRSGRYVASTMPSNILNSLEPDAILFVNGDNLTFPLWYAQEVEGVRTDVRVLNAAYLNSPVYAANAFSDWRNSRKVPSVMQRGDIIMGGMRNVRVPLASKDTLPAETAISRMLASHNHAFPSRYVSLKASPDSIVVCDLKDLTSGRSSRAEFGKLMTFNIALSALREGRPVYWVRALGPARQAGLANATSPWIFGYRLGFMPPHESDRAMSGAIKNFRAPNRGRQDVYMDHTPASMIALQRTALIRASLTLLRHGKTEDAARGAAMADQQMGEHYDSFGNILTDDGNVVNSRLLLAGLLEECADSLEHCKSAFNKARAMEFRARASLHRSEYEKHTRAWETYRNRLPARLKSKMAK